MLSIHAIVIERTEIVPLTCFKCIHYNISRVIYRLGETTRPILMQFRMHVDYDPRSVFSIVCIARAMILTFVKQVVVRRQMLFMYMFIVSDVQKLYKVVGVAHIKVRRRTTTYNVTHFSSSSYDITV